MLMESLMHFFKRLCDLRYGRLKNQNLPVLRQQRKNLDLSVYRSIRSLMIKPLFLTFLFVKVLPPKRHPPRYKQLFFTNKKIIVAVSSGTTT